MTLSKPQVAALRYYRARDLGQTEAAVITTGTREALVYRGLVEWKQCRIGAGDHPFCMSRIHITPAGRAALERHEKGV